MTLDYETKRSYRVTVAVTDGHDELGDDDNSAIDARRNITINLTNVNEAPTVTGAATVTVDENTSGAIDTYTGTDPDRGTTLTWSVSGTTFYVTDRGRLHFRTPPSFESAPSRTVTVTATDDDATNPLSASIDVTVTITDLEEEGVVDITPPRGWTDTDFEAGLTDPDGSVTNQTWQWSRSTNRSNWTDIAAATTDTYTAADDDVDHYLRATVTYTDRRDGGKTAQSELTVRVAAAADKPAANTAPEFADTVTTRTIGQGTRPGRSIGAPVRATDPDSGEVLRYWLEPGTPRSSTSTGRQGRSRPHPCSTPPSRPPTQ